MIQRVQSLFILGVIACMIALLFAPIWKKESSTTTGYETARLNAFELTTSSVSNSNATSDTINTIYIAILAGLCVVVGGFQLFSYKNRVRQRLIGGANSLLMVILLGVTYYFISSASQMVSGKGKEEFGIGFFIIMIAVIFNIIANRFILRDEKIVRSSDRMRD